MHPAALFIPRFLAERGDSLHLPTIVLSPRLNSNSRDENGFTGGEFLFCDQPERKPADRRTIPAGLGDAVLFCTRARLVCVGGAYGLMPVKHGLNRIASGTRYAIGIPFHEFA